MNQQSKKLFQDGYSTIMIYFRCLHLGYFFSTLSQDEDLSSRAKNICIDMRENNKYYLRRDIIRDTLQGIYSKPNKMNIISYLTLADSIRGMSMSILEVLRNKEIQNLFTEKIFRTNKKDFNEFYRLARFIRNTFSHNIRDQVKIEKKFYSKIFEESSKINFNFDYSNSPIPLNRKKYIIKISIDYNKIKDGDCFTDVITEYQNLLFCELCYNCMEYLRDKLS